MRSLVRPSSHPALFNTTFPLLNDGVRSHLPEVFVLLAGSHLRVPAYLYRILERGYHCWLIVVCSLIERCV